MKQILSEILKMRPFLTDADLAKERTEKDRLEKALTQALPTPSKRIRTRIAGFSFAVFFGLSTTENIS